MRVKQSKYIPACELEVAQIDLVARARREIIDNLGDNLISASPALIVEEDKGQLLGIEVRLELDVYESDDFMARMLHLKATLPEEMFKIVLETMSVKDFRDIQIQPKPKEVTDGN